MADKVGKPLWVWSHTATKRGATFQHPADIPVDDEALAKACFTDNLRGPRVAKICPAKLLQDKGDMCTIAEGDGPPRDVGRHMLLRWDEGLLLLQEIEAAAPEKVAWFNSELKAILEQARAKTNGKLRSFCYVEKFLMNKAITGSHFVDNEGRDRKYRRGPLRGDLKISLADGEEGDGFFKFREVSGYLPPWEAFCHEKCGFWQEFYQVRWESPCANVDYSKVENCIGGEVGTTWEPDECLPAHLDPLRIAAKRAWLKARKEEAESLQQQRQLASKSARVQEEEKAAPQTLNTQEEMKSPHSLSARQQGRPTQLLPWSPAKRAKPQETTPVRKKAKGRDGAPLRMDLLNGERGHDFVPPAEEESGEQQRKLCSGWPKRKEEYPPGHGVANPPGFCFPSCDCMDDRRMQHTSEITKPWLEKAERSQAANSALQAFRAQHETVKGTSSPCGFMKPLSAVPKEPHLPGDNLEAVVLQEVLEVLKAVPIAALQEEAIRIPWIAFLGDLDYEPLDVKAEQLLPHWLHLHDGQLKASSRSLVVKAEPMALRFSLYHLEGKVATATVTITSKAQMSNRCDIGSKRIAEHFWRLWRSLQPHTRQVLQGHLEGIFDFGRKWAAKKVSLGEWLSNTARVLRMLRCMAANVNL